MADAGKFDGIIFDVDGTLWDTTGVCAEAWNRAIEENSTEKPGLTADFLKTQFGKPMNVIFSAVLPKLSQEERDRLSEICCEYEERWLRANKVPCYDGVEEGMRRLAERYPLYIVSNCQNGYIEEFLRNSGLGPYITDFMCYGDTLSPKSETMRRLIERNGLKSPVYVGDTEGDANACREAGVPFVFVSYGFGDAKEYYAKADSFKGLEEIF